MSARACCAAVPPRTRGARRAADAAGWLTSGAVLALLPKCPLCLAGYVAVATGVGMSAATAWYVRTGLLVACLSAMTVLAVRLMRSVVAAAAARRG